MRSRLCSMPSVMRSFLPLSTHSSSFLRLLYVWMRYIFPKMHIAYRKRYKFACMLWNVFFDWQKLQVIHGYDVGCLFVTECACFVYYEIIMYFLGGCFRSRCYHHPTEIQSRLCFKLFFAGNDVPKNEKEEKGRRKREALANDELNVDVMLRWVKDMM